MTTAHRRRSRTRLLVAGAATAAVAMSGGAVGIASAATAPAALAFVAATTNVTAERYANGDDVWLDLDLGANLIAGKDPFEIRTSRPSYAKPIVAQQIVVKNGKKTSVPLPKGFVTDFGGLRNFTAITVKNAAGATVKTYQTDFCANDYSSARTRRDAPANNPYPRGCARGNPFTLGAVWGVQAGWNARVDSVPQYDEQAPFDIAAGKYAVTVTINKKYRDYFKIPVAKAAVKVNLTVVDVKDGDGGGANGVARKAAQARAVRAGAGTAAAAVAAHGVHVGEGDPNHQASAFSPQLRPPARRPVTMAAAAAPKGPRPDLRSLPAWGISLEPGMDPKTEKPDGHWFVNFGATVWNGGTSPLLVDGFRRSGTELMDAYQYFFDAKGKQVGSVNAGTMQWDARTGHMHWHFTDFAQYRLLKADQKIVVKSGKEAFCLANTDAVDYNLPGAKWRPDNTDLSSSCGQNSAVAVREVLDIGNGDTYTQDRPGQSFEVTNLPNGTYYIQVLANPAKKLAESNMANNSSLRKVVLSGTKANRKLTVPPVNGIQG